MLAPVLDPSTFDGRGCAGHRCRQNCAADVQYVVGPRLVSSAATTGASSKLGGAGVFQVGIDSELDWGV